MPSDVIPTSSKVKGSDELLCSVTRYGPRTSCHCKGLMETSGRDSRQKPGRSYSTRRCYTLLRKHQGNLSTDRRPDERFNETRCNLALANTYVNCSTRAPYWNIFDVRSRVALSKRCCSLLVLIILRDSFDR